jgi:hypothetical protein
MIPTVKTQGCLCPRHGNVSPTTLFAPAKGAGVQKRQHFFDLLAGFQTTRGSVAVSDLRRRFGRSFVKGAGRDLFNFYPCLTEVVDGLIPPATALITLAERNLGKLCTAENLEATRAEVARLATQAAHGIKRAGLLNLLAEHIQGGRIDGPADQIVDTLIEKYEPEVRAANNAGISLAGRVHELVLQRALELQGLKPGTDFDKPPKPSRQGDIRFHSRRDKNQLRTEVKSLAARERFERGLGELQPPKVGVGFFNDATEFGADATRRLLQQGVNAVYMPQATLDGLAPVSRRATNAQGDPFYRPVSQYPGDMVQFVQSGREP